MPRLCPAAAEHVTDSMTEPRQIEENNVIGETRSAICTSLQSFLHLSTAPAQDPAWMFSRIMILSKENCIAPRNTRRTSHCHRDTLLRKVYQRRYRNQYHHTFSKRGAERNHVFRSSAARRFGSGRSCTRGCFNADNRRAGLNWAKLSNITETD